MENRMGNVHIMNKSVNIIRRSGKMANALELLKSRGGVG